MTSKLQVLSDEELGDEIAHYFASAPAIFVAKEWTVKLINKQKIAHAEYVIGENAKPMMGGKFISRGETVTIDLDNNMKESLIFIEENARYGLQQEQRKRNV